MDDMQTSNLLEKLSESGEPDDAHQIAFIGKQYPVQALSALDNSGCLGFLPHLATSIAVYQIEQENDISPVVTAQALSILADHYKISAHNIRKNIAAATAELAIAALRQGTEDLPALTARRLEKSFRAVDDSGMFPHIGLQNVWGQAAGNPGHLAQQHATDILKKYLPQEPGRHQELTLA